MNTRKFFSRRGTFLKEHHFHSWGEEVAEHLVEAHD